MKIATLITVFLVIAGVIGWIKNIVIICHSYVDMNHITGMFIARIIGVFIAPLGSVLGFIG